jgi:hypothetical protein
MSVGTGSWWVVRAFELVALAVLRLRFFHASFLPSFVSVTLGGASSSQVAWRWVERPVDRYEWDQGGDSHGSLAIDAYSNGEIQRPCELNRDDSLGNQEPLAGQAGTADSEYRPDEEVRTVTTNHPIAEREGTRGRSAVLMRNVHSAAIALEEIWNTVHVGASQR